MSVNDVIGQLSELTDLVVLTGGEPLDQNISGLLAALIVKKYIILETAKYNTYAYGLVDKVLFCIKTFDLDEKGILKADMNDKVDFVIIIGHDCFNIEGFKKAHKLIKNRPIYHRYNVSRNTYPVKFNELYRFVKNQRKEFLVFNKICL